MHLLPSVTIKRVLQHVKSLVPEAATALDLGCGSSPRNPLGCARLIGVDIFPEISSEILLPGFEYRRATSKVPIPTDPGSCAVIYAFDFLEHLDKSPSKNFKPNQFIQMMNEIWTALAPGGFLVAATPVFPSVAAFNDPTHSNHIGPDTHLYFSDYCWARTKGYGFVGDFATKLAVKTSPDRAPELWAAQTPGGADALGSSGKRKSLRSIFRSKIRAINSPSHIVWILEKRQVSRG